MQALLLVRIPNWGKANESGRMRTCSYFPLSAKTERLDFSARGQTEGLHSSVWQNKEKHILKHSCRNSLESSNKRGERERAKVEKAECGLPKSACIYRVV